MIALNGGPLNAGIMEEACVSPRRAFAAIFVRDREKQVWWTTDGGRHWYRTRRVSPDLLASAGRVYWLFGPRIYRLRRWPSAPIARRVCRNFSSRGACLRPPIVDAGARSSPLVRLEGAAFDRDSVVVLRDRFIAPVLNTAAVLPPRAVLVRGLSVRVINLPDVGWYVCGGAAAPANIAQIFINGCRDGRGVGAWTSSDGGLSWTVA
jgi:hypothetical protein